MSAIHYSGVRCYRFGAYVLDAHRSQLWGGGALVPLTPKAIEVLIVLVESPGVVSKEALIRAVWPDTAVEENNLARNISTLRKALHERPDEHEFIVTVPGLGYRFVAPVERLEPGIAISGEAATQTPPVAAVSLPVGESELGSRANVSEPARAARRVFPRSVLAAALASLVVAGGFLTWRMIEGLSSAGRSEAARDVRALTYGAGLKQQPTWSPDGQFLAYAAEDQGSSDIWVQSVSNPVPVRLTESDDQDWQPAWSPDGRSIAFRSERDGGGLYTVAATGGPARRITPFGFRPQWSPSGKRILFSTTSGPDAPGSILYTVDVDGLNPRPVEHDSLRNLRVMHATWFPTGDRISVLARRSRSRWELVTFPANGAGQAITSTIAPAVAKGLEESAVVLTAFAWSRSARQLFFSGRSGDVANLWRITVDPDTLAWIGGPDRLTTGAGDDLEPSVSPDGKQLAFSVQSARTRLWSFPFDSKAGQLTGTGLPLTPGGPGEFDAAVPPDGSRVAYRTSRGGREELWETSTQDGRGRLLLAGPWAQTSPRWSQDGTRLAYQRRGLGPGLGASAIRILAPDSGIERSLPAQEFDDLVPDDWSADGEWILASCRRKPDNRRETCLVAAGASAAPEVRVIASDPARDLICQRFSPDGQWISFMATDMRNARVSTLYVMPAAGGSWIPLTAGASYDDKPRWAPDGRTVYFVSNRSGLLDVWGRRFDSATGQPVGEPFRVSNFTDPKKLVARELGRVEIAIVADRLFLPITESTGQIWLLRDVSR